MSDELESSPKISPDPSAESKPRARKTAARRPKKPGVFTESVTEEAVTPSAAPPESSSPPEATAGDWPEPEPESSGAATKTESGKRKRRRKKGKGQASQTANAGIPQVEEIQSPESKPSDAPKDQAPRPQPPPRVKIDSDLLAKFAWKIYLAEVSEEGVALISDNDAKDLSRRCFRLAEIFIEEQSRRR